VRIAITGAGGKMGVPLVQLALNAGHTVVAIDRVPSSSLPAPRSELEEHVLDVADYGALVSTLHGCEAVIHTAAFVQPWAAPEPQVHNANVVGSYNVLAAAEANGIGRVCLSSSVNAIGAFYSANPRYDYFPVDEDHPCYAEDPYSLSKWASEEQARAFCRRAPGMSVISLRLHRLVNEAQLETWTEQATARSDQDRKDLWGYTPMPMAVEAALIAVTRDFVGAEVVYVVADKTWHPRSSDQLAKNYYPDVPLRQAMDGRRSFYDSAKYKELLA
jgi:nucleoside-diphosphate-sugar epimerase